MKRKLLAYLLTGALAASMPAVQTSVIFADDITEDYVIGNDEYLDIWVDQEYMTEDELYDWVDEDDYGGYDEEDYYDDYYEEEYYDDYDYSDYSEEGSETAETAAEETEEKSTVARRSVELKSSSEIEEALNLKNMTNQEWSYSVDADAWTLSSVPAVANPEIASEEGVSVCVPGAYVSGIDKDGDGKADVTAAGGNKTAVGSLVIELAGKVTSSNGQTYTARTAPVIINTGAEGYSEQRNQTASAEYASEGYINVACGNRGRQSTAINDDGEVYYTGDAPSCLVDQKCAVRFVKYNILLGNLPGSVDYFVSTGKSGGGAHAVMLAATSDHPDFYDYEIEVGAVGVYKDDEGNYSTTVSARGSEYELSDGVWGCIAYSPVTSLAEADMAMAFEYTLDPSYSFKTDFQKQLAGYLAEEYMNYINGKNLTMKEAVLNVDINGDGDTIDSIPVKIEHDLTKYPDNNGYGGSYVDLYLEGMISNLQWYLNNLDYAEGWTWFGEDGKALSDIEVAAMTTADKGKAFIEGRYAKGSLSTGGFGAANDLGTITPAALTEETSALTEGTAAGNSIVIPLTTSSTESAESDAAEAVPVLAAEMSSTQTGEINLLAENDPVEEAESAAEAAVSPAAEAAAAGAESEAESAPAEAVTETASEPVVIKEITGTPSQGTTAAAGTSADSKKYTGFGEMAEAYSAETAEIEEGDRYGNNIVSLYDPVRYIGAEGTKKPSWTRIVMGADEGDMPLLASLNLGLSWLDAGTDAVIEWQWDGGHVPEEIFGNSFALYVDQMYGKHAAGGASVMKAAPKKQTENGTALMATGTDISSFVDASDPSHVSFTAEAAAKYRTKNAVKGTPGFDAMDYTTENYVFGSADQDARHFEPAVSRVFEEHADELAPLFNK